MQIQSQLPAIATSADPTTAATSSTNTGTKSSSTDQTSALANENTFLQLMVAQLKNQDPLQPTDGAQFLGQLAQFSQLEQLIGLRQDLKTQTPAATTPATTAA